MTLSDLENGLFCGCRRGLFLIDNGLSYDPVQEKAYCINKAWYTNFPPENVKYFLTYFGGYTAEPTAVTCTGTRVPKFTAAVSSRIGNGAKPTTAGTVRGVAANECLSVVESSIPLPVGILGGTSVADSFSLKHVLGSLGYL